MKTFDLLKRASLLSLLVLMAGSISCMAQNKQLEKATNKMYKEKMKEYKREGWKLAGNSKTLEVALLEHYEKLKDPDNTELVGEVTFRSARLQCEVIDIGAYEW